MVQQWQMTFKCIFYLYYKEAVSDIWQFIYLFIGFQAK